MRILILSILLLSASAVLACEPEEAQFIGKVKNFSEVQKSETTSECSFQIEINTFNASGTCPLDSDQAQNYFFQDGTCVKKNGDFLSGILVKTGSVIIIE